MIILYSLFIIIFSIYTYKATNSFYVVLFTLIVMLPYLSSEIKIKGIFWLPYILVYCIIIFNLLIKKRKHKEDLFSNHKLSLFIIIGLFIISLIFTSGSFTNVIEWIIRYCTPFIILFIIIRNPIPDYSVKKAFNIFKYLLIIQFIMNISWKMGINPLPNQRVIQNNQLDYAFGSFAYTPALGDFISIGILFYLLNVVIREKRTWSIILLMLTMFMVFIEANNNHLIPILLISILTELYLFYKKNFKYKNIVIGLIAVGMIVFLMQIMVNSNLTYKGKFNLDMSTNQSIKYGIETYQDRLFTSMKYTGIIYTINYMENASIGRLLFGYGPGSMGSIVGRNNTSDFRLFYNIDYAGDSIALDPSSLLIALITEFGLIGLIATTVILLVIIKYLFNKINNSVYYVEYIGLFGILTYFLLLALIRDFICTPPFFAACILIGLSINRLKYIFAQ